MSNTTQTSPQTTRDKLAISFAAIDPVIETNIVSAEEKKLTLGSHDMISWGERNSYPLYLIDLYENVPNLNSVINGCVDYVLGNGVTTTIDLQEGAMNEKGESIADLIRLLSFDYFLFHGCAFQVTRNAARGIASVNYIDLQYLRTNANADVFYYSEDFAKKYQRTKTIQVYPKFKKNIETLEGNETAVVYIKSPNKKVYPTPLYGAAVKACEIERSIDIFHLNSINNGFVSSLFVNFNNGVPDEKQQEEVEDDFNEKFTGPENAMRVGFSWNADRNHATTFDQFKIEDFGSQYEALSKRSRQQIFTAFRANPNLFGIPTDNLGFSSEEYEAAFELFNKTQIAPVQDLFKRTFDMVFDQTDAITFDPFTLAQKRVQSV